MSVDDVALLRTMGTKPRPVQLRTGLTSLVVVPVLPFVRIPMTVPVTSVPTVTVIT